MDSDANDLCSRERIRWGDEIKVYTRRNRKKNDVFPATTTAAAAAAVEAAPPPATKGNQNANDNNKLLIDNFTSGNVPGAGGGGGGGANVFVNEPLITRIDGDRVRISLTGSTRSRVEEIRRVLEGEVDQVRSLVKKLEAKERLQLTLRDSGNRDVGSSIAGFIGGGGRGIISRNYARPTGVDNRSLVRVNSELGSMGRGVDNRSLVRVNSEVGSMGRQRIQVRPFPRPPGLAVVVRNDGGGELVEREKRTPKANQYYKKSEFLLGKDRLPSESNKKSKTNGGGKKNRGGSKHGFAFDDKYRKQLFRSCSDLLGRLMKHKHGWVFNEPVNVKALGLHDYLDIIKHPMDLGTIKARLSENWYKSPKEFAEDIRLVFTNAKIYNPEGQDVHVMAEELSQIFEERWAAIEVKFNPEWRYQMYHDAGLPIPTPKKVGRPRNVVREQPYHALRHAPQARTLERSESITGAVDSRKKASSYSHAGRTPVPKKPKKPKAKDPNKRDMTYDEKQKLSSELEKLPQEKLDSIVDIVKKRSSAVNQTNEEIEVDIDSVDAETLWELDRFVSNYKKSLTKTKRKAETALQARAAQSAPITNSGPMVADALKESITGGMHTNAPSTHVEGGKQADNARSSSSSSSSSSDSGSSSSDSDSDSSSSCESDAGH